VIGDVFTSTFEILRERWKQIVGSIAASVVLVGILAFVLLVPAVQGVLSSAQAPGSASLAASQERSTSIDPVTGAPRTDPFASDEVSVAGSRESVTTTASGLDSGAITKLFVAFALIALASIAAVNTGVFAATGSTVGESLVEGARTTPHVLVQSLRIGGVAWGVYAAGVVVMFALGGAGGFLLGGLLLLVGLVLLLRVCGTLWLSLGSIAHGHVSYSPEAARDAAAGREWSATGVAFVGGLVGSASNAIPVAGMFLGPLFMSAYIAAMWREFDRGNEPTTTIGVPDPNGMGAGSRTVPDVIAPPAAAPIDPAAAARVSVPVSAPASAVAATPAASLAATPASSLVAGPAWNGVGGPTEPLGHWFELAVPSKVAMQAQWTVGDAPALQLADQAGTWTTPAAQPTTSGETTWLELPAGWTWIALVPPARQQLWVTTWLPADAGATGSAAA
jgi:hypothetical protein